VLVIPATPRPRPAGSTALHCAAAGGYEDCVEALLEAGADVMARDAKGSTALHVAAEASVQAGQRPLEAQQPHAPPTSSHTPDTEPATEPCAVCRPALQGAIPMCVYQLANRTPAACLEQNSKQQTPVELAAASAKGEVRAWLGSRPRTLNVVGECLAMGRRVWAMHPLLSLLLHAADRSSQCPNPACLQVLNAMLLACAGHATPEALSSMRALLKAGAVCDTWCAQTSRPSSVVCWPAWRGPGCLIWHVSLS
jgi:hypothetical protein